MTPLEALQWIIVALVGAFAAAVIIVIILSVIQWGRRD